MLYRTGTFTLAANNVAYNLNLGFIPDSLYLLDVTYSSTATNLIEANWNSGTGTYTTPYTIVRSTASGTLTLSAPTTTGVVPYQTPDSNLYVPNQAPYTTTSGNRAYVGASTELVITGISNAANASVTATHSFTTSDIGVTVVTFHGVLGMTQINTLSGVITGVTSTTSFTVNINSTNFGVYSAGTTAGVTSGFANVITGAPVDTLYGNTLLPTAEANLGFIGVTIGTAVIGAGSAGSTDTWWYQAMLQSPVTGP
jgi:hypothetical protein